MNNFIKLEITNELLVTENFVNTCKIDAMKDDGTIDKSEKKILDEIEKASVQFTKSLNKILEKNK